MSAHVNLPCVLFVDDDPAVRGAVARQAKRCGFEALEASNGVEGYWLAQSQLPNVVVTDLRMPLGQGEDLIDAIRHNRSTSRIPIVVMTALCDRETRARLVGAGVPVLEKPFSFDALLVAMAGVLRRDGGNGAPPPTESGPNQLTI